jgi:hypothetical protein
MALSSRSELLVVVLQLLLYGAGRFEGRSRTMPVATFSHPL